jgi:outer membrane protein
MKKSIILSILFCITAFSAFSQEQKIGFVDIDYVLGELPAAKKVTEQLQAMEAELVKQYELKQTEFKTKYADFLKPENQMAMVDVVRESTLKELKMLEANLQQFQTDADASLQKKRHDLSAPLFKMVGDAVNAVAKENGYTYVLNPRISGMDIILFADEKGDISDLVLKKLGVTPKVAANVPNQK